jgi:hypothetical protein
MRRGIGIGVTILAIATAVGIGIGAYNIGLHHAVAREGGTEVVRVVGHGWGYGPGFGFPFGIILFPLFVIGILLLVRGAFWRGRWGGPGAYGRPGPWQWGGGPEEWHRQMHEQGGAQPGTRQAGPQTTTRQDEPGGSDASGRGGPASA